MFGIKRREARNFELGHHRLRANNFHLQDKEKVIPRAQVSANLPTSFFQRECAPQIQFQIYEPR